MRKDLPLGILVAQITHAAGESIRHPLPHGTFAIVLAVPNENTLRDLSRTLEYKGIQHVLITESDPPFSGEATAIGVEPNLRNALKRHFSSLPLLRSTT